MIGGRFFLFFFSRVWHGLIKEYCVIFKKVRFVRKILGFIFSQTKKKGYGKDHRTSTANVFPLLLISTFNVVVMIMNYVFLALPLSQRKMSNGKVSLFLCCSVELQIEAKWNGEKERKREKKAKRLESQNKNVYKNKPSTNVY